MITEDYYESLENKELSRRWRKALPQDSETSIMETEKDIANWQFISESRVRIVNAGKSFYNE